LVFCWSVLDVDAYTVNKCSEFFYVHSLLPVLPL
jgi:hypothetical protein